MPEDPVTTTIGFAFPTTNWLDPFDVDEAATQWFFVNQSRISRAWTAPTEDDAVSAWGLGTDDSWREVFTNPRSCLYCLEKSAVAADGQVLREYAPSSRVRAAAPESCGQHNGLYVVYSQAQHLYQVHEAVKFATYDEALREALTQQDSGSRVMVARVVDGESLW